MIAIVDDFVRGDWRIKYVLEAVALRAWGCRALMRPVADAYLGRGDARKLLFWTEVRRFPQISGAQDGEIGGLEGLGRDERGTARSHDT